MIRTFTAKKILAKRGHLTPTKGEQNRARKSRIKNHSVRTKRSCRPAQKKYYDN